MHISNHIIKNDDQILIKSCFNMICFNMISTTCFNMIQQILFLVSNDDQILFQHLLRCLSKCPVFYVDYKALCIHATYFAISPYFGFTQLYQNLCITILLISNIYKSKKNRFTHKYFSVILKICCMVVWFSYHIISYSLSCYKFYISMFSNIFP